MSLQFINVSKSFGSKHVLKSVSFEIHPGNIVFILGRSGTGKSVTLKTLVGLLKPDFGEVIVSNHNVHNLNEEQLGLVRQECGMVFQHPALLDSLTVYENIGFGIQHWDEDTKRPRILECLALVHLESNIIDKLPSEISYGMQKRVSLARTIAPKPKYLLFDEPTTGLDPITTSAINDLILELSNKLKVTSVVVSHDMSSALKIANRILVLDQGKVLAYETVDQIRKNTNPLIQEFLMDM